MSKINEQDTLQWYFSHYLQSNSFSHYPQVMTIVEDLIKEKLVNWEVFLRLSSRFQQQQFVQYLWLLVLLQSSPKSFQLSIMESVWDYVNRQKTLR